MGSESENYPLCLLLRPHGGGEGGLAKEDEVREVAWISYCNLCLRYHYESLRDSARAAGSGALRIITEPFKMIFET